MLSLQQLQYLAFPQSFFHNDENPPSSDATLRGSSLLKQLSLSRKLSKDYHLLILKKTMSTSGKYANYIIGQAHASCNLFFAQTSPPRSTIIINNIWAVQLCLAVQLSMLFLVDSLKTWQKVMMSSVIKLTTAVVGMWARVENNHNTWCPYKKYPSILFLLRSSGAQ